MYQMIGKSYPKMKIIEIERVKLEQQVYD